MDDDIDIAAAVRETETLGTAIDRLARYDDRHDVTDGCHDPRRISRYNAALQTVRQRIASERGARTASTVRDAAETGDFERAYDVLGVEPGTATDEDSYGRT